MSSCQGLSGQTTSQAHIPGLTHELGMHFPHGGFLVITYYQVRGKSDPYARMSDTINALKLSVLLFARSTYFIL